MDELIQASPEKILDLLRAVKSGEPISVSIFARLTGTPEQNVLKAWKNGVLPSAPGGRIPPREGVVALCSLDGHLRKKGTPTPEFLSRADALSRELLGLPERSVEATEIPLAGSSHDDDYMELKIKYLKAQTAAKTALAVQKNMENDIKRGVYVKAKDVELDAATTAAHIAGVLMRLPLRAAGLCEGRTAEEISAILQKEIRLAFDEIQASAFTGDWSDL